MRKIIKLFSVGSVALIVNYGCTVTNTPFVPVAVPVANSLKPVNEIDKNCQVNRKALMALHKIQVPDYMIMPGDSLSMAIANREDLSRPGMIVMADGAISVAPVGRIKIGGLTLAQASEKLSRCYRKYIRDCEIILEPLIVKQASVIVTGAVGGGASIGGAGATGSTTGIPIVAGKTRLSDVIAMAGGLRSTENQDSLADLKHAVIIRNSKVLPVDFELLLKSNDQLHNIPLLDGDYIDIPSLNNTRICVLGEVGHPNSVIYQPGMTLLELLAKSGGLKETNSRHIKIIRGGLINPTVYNINIRDMQLGRILDFPVQPKDIVFVPRDPVSEWNVIIRQITPSIQLINGLAGPFGNPSAFIYK